MLRAVNRIFAPTLGAVLLLAGCGLPPTASGGDAGGKVEVVVAENFWGSIASQLGGEHARVSSIITNPDTDPHAYEAKPEDARSIARARYVVSNGAGYDPWVAKLAAANPVPGRRQLVIADLVGRREGDNPHFWYSPKYVGQVVDRITSDLKQVDGADATYFDEQNRAYRASSLRDYQDTIAVIRARYAGTPVGATESIFAYLSAEVGLKLVTPAEYMKAISEGTDPSAGDKVAIEDQVAKGQVKALVFNSQNTTPDVKALVDRARARGIPVVAVTETLTPASATFQAWQTAQLRALLAALGG